ncbi:universal stress protein [Cohnella sp. JJ-181]|uniref:universal stress protein n=1 Tax=Cohnella rhizoplanae TaxID=2974897 RepID=UPI0022FF8265|nr:universal stress protein [Cohnella sp. JJ-181]CAI6085095.1 Stress response protein NhaX [Cohnella sp. JJ-181]
MSYTNILVAYDGSNLSRKALSQAAALADSYQATLTVVHVYQVPLVNNGDFMVTLPADWSRQYMDQSFKVLEEAKTLVPATVKAEFKLIDGDPAGTILDYAGDNGVDLIVLGSRGLGGIREFVLGSVSHNVMQHAKAPVLIVK